MARIRFDELAAAVRRRQPACGSTTVVAIDGPSGAGKSVLAHGLADVLGAAVLGLDDVVPGWYGLGSVPPMIAHDVLAPIAAGETGRVRRWDWDEDRSGDLMECPPVPHLVIDGCGSGSVLVRPYLSLLVWVDAPAAVRRERALARDGDAYDPWWDVWADQEREHYASEHTQGAADVRIRSG